MKKETYIKTAETVLQNHKALLKGIESFYDKAIRCVSEENPKVYAHIEDIKDCFYASDRMLADLHEGLRSYIAYPANLDEPQEEGDEDE